MAGLVDVVPNDSQKRIAMTEEQQEIWMGFIREDKTYTKYYDEFVVLLTGSDCVHIAAVMARLQALLDERNASASRGYAIRFSVGQIEYDPQHHDSVASLLLDADRAMYVHKQTLKRG